MMYVCDSQKGEPAMIVHIRPAQTECKSNRSFVSFIMKLVPQRRYTSTRDHGYRSELLGIQQAGGASGSWHQDHHCMMFGEYGASARGYVSAVATLGTEPAAGKVAPQL